jgi:hypothetical protein
VAALQRDGSREKARRPARQFRRDIMVIWARVCNSNIDGENIEILDFFFSQH